MSGAEAVVGVAAAGVGFASLAIQLLDSIQKLKAFQGKVKNASITLEDLIFDLETMGLRLDQLERHKSHDNAEAGLLARCLDRCRVMTDRVQVIVDKMQRVNLRNARLGKLYTAFKDPDIAKLLTELEQAKASLSLSLLTVYSEQQSRLHHDQIAIMQRQNTQLALIWTHTQANIGALASHSDPSSHPDLVPSVQHDRVDHLWLQTQPSHDDSHVSVQSRRHVKRNSKKRALKFTLYFPRQICSRVWNISFMQAQSGWDIKLRVYMAREPGSEIFQRCLTGDVKAVQRMIAEGEASLRDYSPLMVVVGPNHYFVHNEETVEHDLLWVAACSGQAHLVEWLLQAFAESREISLERLFWVSRFQGTPVSAMDQVLRRLLQSDSVSLGVDLTKPFSCNFLQLMEESQIKIMLDSGVLSECQQSALHTFEAIYSESYDLRFITAKTFLKLVGLKSTSPELVTLITRDGRFSTLHFAATMLARAPEDLISTDPTIEDWFAIASTVLKLGFKPSTVTDDDRTALWCLVIECPKTRRGIRWISTAMRAWVRTVQEVGIDLLEYGRDEAEIWRLRNERYMSKPRLSYGHTPDQWSATRPAFTVETVPLYEVERMPGTFEHSSYIPKYICWFPDSFDEGAHSWRFVEVNYWRHSRDANQEDEDNQSENEDPPVNTYLSRDEASLIVMVASRSTRWIVTPRRSASVPPTIHGQYAKPGRSAPFNPPAWHRGVHFCHATASYEYVYPYQLRARACANGACRRADHSPLLVQADFRWSRASFLTDIRDCQDGYVCRNPDSRHFRSSLSAHTGTKDCPLGCRKVHLDKLRVPEACREYHPLRNTSDRWNDP